MSRFLRYLRIAFSATCLIACVLLIWLWVRSYAWGDSYLKQVGQSYCGGSTLRGLIILHWFEVEKGEKLDTGYTWGPAKKQKLARDFREPFFGFYLTKFRRGFALVVPMWFLITASVGCAVAPWLSWRRFSLRTLLIATTLIAVMLGAIVWFS